MQHRMSQKEGREKLFESYKLQSARKFVPTRTRNAHRLRRTLIGILNWRVDNAVHQSLLFPHWRYSLAADDIGFTGLCVRGQKYFALYLDKEHEEKEVALFEKVKQWLDIYFSGKEPDFTVPLHFTGTDFQNEVMGNPLYYSIRPDDDIRRNCKQIAVKKGLPRMSAQAVGGAVGHNKISIIVPCHRVVGTNGSLTDMQAV